jgi:recombination protein RecR
MNSSQGLEEIFARFPGIGPRQARRFVYYLMNKSPTFIKEFIQTINEVKKSTNECENCRRFFIEEESGLNQPSKKRQKTLCDICSDLNRDRSVLMIVTRESDFESVEKSGAYKGLYFILGGTVPILDKEPEKRIRLRALLDRISNDSGLNEIILSLNTTPDGEHTMTIVKEAIEKLARPKRIKISVLGRGLSTGAELEYADSDTIRNALKNRQ